MTLAEVLAEARQQIPPAEARLLLGHVLNQTAVWIEMHRDDTLPADSHAAFAEQVSRRAAGEPVAYLLGTREFYGRDFAVTPDVLIPRPETELLVDLVKQKVDAGRTASLLDLGTGSGCIAVTLALELPMSRITAVDFSEAALGVARQNAARLGAAITFLHSDWFAGLPAQTFDLIVANPPYIAAADPHLSQGDLRFEPATALTDHANGLSALQRIIADAPAWLNPGGWLWLEHGYDQAPAVRQLLEDAGFASIEQVQDLAGIVRASGGKIPNQFTQTLQGPPT